MPVLKEYCCRAHGPFEGFRPVCPRGCTTVERRFYTAPAVRTNGHTKAVDKSLNDLAGQFRLTDMRNDGGRSSVAACRRQSFSPDIEAAYEKIGGPWQTVPKGGQYVVGRGPQNQGPGAHAAVQSRMADNVAPIDYVQAVKPELQRPKTIIAGRYDHPIDPKYAPDQ
jgi:hypothetical protein